MRKHISRTATAVLTAGALVLPLASPAAAAPGDVSEPLADGLVGPLDLSVALLDGSVYVAEAFSGQLTRIAPDGSTTTEAAASEGGEIAGVDATRRAKRAYVTSYGDQGQALMRLRHNGTSYRMLDLQAYEETENPDGDVPYGFLDLPAGCQAGPAGTPFATDGYSGIVESHPYAVAQTPNGWTVADAAGNSLIEVGWTGEASTLAVLPTHELDVTAQVRQAVNAFIAEMNAGNEPGDPDMAPLPECVVGSTYAFESVPTDVEMGPDGKLYVSTLPGGPESPALGGRGKVFSVDRDSGAVTEVASGFVAATDLAVADDGTIYVAELFGGQVSKVVDGAPETLAEVPLPGALEWHDGLLYAAIDVFPGEQGPAGKVVTIQP